MAGEEGIAFSQRGDSIDNLIDVKSGELPGVAKAVVPKVVEGGAIHGMDECVAGEGDFCAVHSGGDILLEVPQSVTHDEWNRRYCDLV